MCQIFWKLTTHLPLINLLEFVIKLNILFSKIIFILIGCVSLCLFANPEVFVLAF